MQRPTKSEASSFSGYLIVASFMCDKMNTKAMVTFVGAGVVRVGNVGVCF